MPPWETVGDFFIFQSRRGWWVRGGVMGEKSQLVRLFFLFLASEWGFGTMGREGESFSFTYGKRNRAAAVLRGGADF